jgi:hypothetical protein
MPVGKSSIVSPGAIKALQGRRNKEGTISATQPWVVYTQKKTGLFFRQLVWKAPAVT